MKRDLDKYYSDYINQPFEKIQVSYRKNKVLERLGHYNPKRILEVGVGTQSQLLLDFEFEKLNIIEPSKVFYNLNKKLIKDNKIKNVTIENCFFEQFDSNASFDFILISSLLHEIEDLDIFIKKLIQICSNKTVVHINVPNANSFHRLLAKSMGIINNTREKSKSNIKLQTSRIFDIISLEKLIRVNDFKILHKESFFIKPFTHEQMQKMLNSEIINIDILNGLYNLNFDNLESNDFLGSELIVEFTV
jgi:ubiquinone/menaquinone biosynthesis C-methylase UbiE